MKSFSTPILFLIFNRPIETQVVFDEIKKLKPKFLYIGADGPRINNPQDFELCRSTREVVSQIDWDCQVKTLFRNENLGCGLAPATAITWFFENVESGIILEDDCLPTPDFFPYCQELLERYKDNTQIMHISGNNFQRNKKRGSADYYFSLYNHIWGWATWRRAWQTYDIQMKTFDKESFDRKLEMLSRKPSFTKYWLDVFERCHSEQPRDIWDYQWKYTMWYNNGLSIIPQVNLVKNIGFGSRATHTKDIKNWRANLHVSSLTLTKHPKEIKVNISADTYTSTYVFNIGRNQDLVTLVKRSVKRLGNLILPVRAGAK